MRAPTSVACVARPVHLVVFADGLGSADSMARLAMSATTAAMNTALLSVGGSPAMSATRVAMLSGTGMTAAGTAAIIAVTASPSGMSPQPRAVTIGITHTG